GRRFRLPGGLWLQRARAAYTSQNGYVVGACSRNAAEPARAPARWRPCDTNPVARKTKGRAKPRGVGSYSKVRTAGPEMVAPSETIAAISRDAPVDNPAAAAIRYGPQIPSARQITCSRARTSRNGKPVTLRN